jgi:site-specific recombinase XerD
MNTSVKTVLYTSKKLSNGEHPVMLRVIKDRKSKYLSIGFSCSKELWDFKTNLPKRKHPHHQEIGILLTKKKLDAERLLYELENEDKNLSAYEIKTKLTKKKVNNPLVFDYFDNIINRLIVSGHIKTAEVYKDTRKNLQYYTSKNLHFSDIDVQFLNGFEEHLIVKGKGGNTIYIYLRTLRALINKAIKEEVCGEKYYAFKKFSLSKYSKIKTVKRALSKDEIRKIMLLNTNEWPTLTDSKNIFLFSFYCRGMNFVDIAFLKWSDIKKDRLIYTRKKTRELFNLQLLQPAQDIINYYKDQTLKNNNSFVFPLLKETHSTPIMIYNRKLRMLRKINEGLKEIAKIVGIHSNLTTYVARHSYATILKKSGISTTVISQALGHESEKTTQIYLESFENSIIDEASRFVLLL